MAKTALIGFMGAGKTTAARALGETAIDVDEVIEARLGRRVQDVFAQQGEAAFREVEERVTLEMLADPGVEVVALGGGAIGSAAVRDALKNCRVIWLETVWEDAWRRVEANGSRPLASDMRRFTELHDARQPVYESLADVIVPATRSRQIKDVLDALVGLPDHGTRMLWATSASSDYPVYIGAGLVTDHSFWPAAITGRRLLVTDYHAGRLYGERFMPLLGDVRIMPGEQSKTIAHAEIVWTEMVRHGATRADVMVALGGGVVGDLAGFCAATYQRGMRVVQVPSTLVAQVDSAIGGKTGVDLPEAKNYVGAFHQPSAVIADPATLKTLPPAELAAGYAEVVKTGLIAGGALWDRLRTGASPTDPELIAACAHVKVRVVSQDERDLGLRQVLNLGHTVGHAIETATGYARYRHGEAVGLGLLAELRLSGADELRTQVREMLLGAGLPVVLEGTDVDTVIYATGRDKKRVAAGPVPFVLCPEPGRPTAGQSVDPADLRGAVQELIAP
ncbi:MAG TPA: bifunctional shikimate kinase/3-dehydroquinate synthase [Solirubrobacteraceae bacterium]|nr:bifunctional shikimate kinase/3-dehydroquinate synthase [Solirubrobacteraceae bacterium]